MQRSRMVFPYRRFGTDYGPIFKGQAVFFSFFFLLLLHLLFLLLGLLDLWRWDRHGVPKRRYGTTVLRCVKSQNSAYATVDFWNA